MTEAEYRLLHFEENLGKLRGKRIFLYGYGRNTKAVLEKFGPSFGFEGVILPENEIRAHNAAPDPAGVRFLSLSEALLERPDAILLGAQMYSIDAVYQRICADALRAGVRIYDLYGHDEGKLHEALYACRHQDAAGWAAVTAPYDVISFAAENTLLPENLFGDGVSRIRPVFRTLLPMLRKSRKTMLAILEDAAAEHALRRALGEADLPKDIFDRILVHTHKENFFRSVREAYPDKRILHIGGDLTVDGIIPRLCGVDSYRMVYFDDALLDGFLQNTEPERERPSETAFRKAVDESDTVSFDLFDTVLYRKCGGPREVWRLAAAEGRKEGVLKGADGERRYLAARAAAECGTVTSSELHFAAAAKAGLAEEAGRRLSELEFETEKSVLCVRPGIRRLMRYAKERGKRVVLTSDMYYSAAELAELLRGAGVTEYDRIFVSSEYGLTKEDGLFEIVRREEAEHAGGPAKAEHTEEAGLGGGNLLHIGDSTAKDIVPARRAGFTAMRIPSVQEDAAVYGIPGAACGAERRIRSLVLAARFSDPFGPAPEERARLYGYAAMGPLLYGWMRWFLRRIRKKTYDAVLFSARDGYLLQKVYEIMKPEGAPPSVYFYTSRRAALLAASDNEKVRSYLSAGGLDPGKVFGGQDPAEARRAQQTYWRKAGLTADGRYALTDFVASGTVQRLLTEEAPFSVDGYCFSRSPGGVVHAPADVYLEGETEEEKAFLARYMEMEQAMSSPEPSLSSFRADGAPVFSEEVRTRREIRDMEEAQNGALAFVTDLCGLLRESEEMPGVPFVCGMYTASSSLCPYRRFYDDLGERWLGRAGEGETEADRILSWYPSSPKDRVLCVRSFADVPEEAAGVRYDTVILLPDGGPAEEETDALVSRLSDLLGPDGVLLAALRENAPGAERDPSGREAEEMFRRAGFTDIFRYRLYPGIKNTDTVLSDSFHTAGRLRGRLQPEDEAEAEEAETDIEAVTGGKEGESLIACRKRKGGRRLIGAFVSADRIREHAAVTRIFDDGYVEKKACFPEGKAAILAQAENAAALRERQLLTVPAEALPDGTIRMPYVTEEPLLSYIGRKSREGRDALIGVFRELERDILRSSPCRGDSFPVLEKGYIDMIPYNAFRGDTGIRYFDQEFVVRNCPLSFILYRMVRYTYLSLPELEKTVGLGEMKRIFGLTGRWEAYTRIEDAFTARLCRRENAAGGRPYVTGFVMGVFDLFHAGHLKLLERAKKYCGILRVGVLSDELAFRYKGKRPVIPLAQRLRIVASMSCVDEAAAVEGDFVSKSAEWYRRPYDVYISGDDHTEDTWRGQDEAELDALGVKMIFLPYTEGISTTRLRERIRGEG
ncbi:MAG: adenylyltransferase/cytidyltransferase family protein [Lachnospiraceae bacterium]|nr:adenylyltransferase/cytidyltransferase family protein [Lachnospiraceae bacterium]